MPFIREATIAHTLLERNRRTPGAIAFKYASRNEAVAKVGTWKEITFREFLHDSELISLGLSKLGMKSGEKAAILSRTSYEWGVADFAIMGVRGISVPIYPSTTGPETLHLLNHSDSVVIFVEDSAQLEKIYPHLEDMPQVRWIIVFDLDAAASLGNRDKVLTYHALKKLGTEALPGNPHQFSKNLEATTPEDILTICYTSGTTGTPKGAVLTHGNLNSVLEDCEKVFSPYIRANHEQLLTFLPFSHIIGRMELMATFVFGWTLNFADHMDDLPRLFREVRPTLIFAVPRIFEKAYSHIAINLRSGTALQRRLFRWALKSGEDVFGRLWTGRRPNPLALARYKMFRELILDRVTEGFGGRLRFAICGGAPLSKEVGEYFQIMGIQILEGYGLTETFAPVALNTPDELRFGSVGKPLPDVEVRIADDGEICLRSKKIFQGYYKMPEETQKTFHDGWFLTGDLGFVDPDGFLHLTDRKKDILITSGGKNVAPQKIENLAKGLSPLIGEFVVIGERKKYLTALITLNRPALERFAEENQVLFSHSAELTHNAKVMDKIEQLVSDLNSQLARFECIKKFIVLPGEFSVAAGELTPSLKVKRSAIYRKYRSEIDQLYREPAEASLEP